MTIWARLEGEASVVVVGVARDAAQPVGDARRAVHLVERHTEACAVRRARDTGRAAQAVVGYGDRAALRVDDGYRLVGVGVRRDAGRSVRRSYARKAVPGIVGVEGRCRPDDGGERVTEVVVRVCEERFPGRIDGGKQVTNVVCVVGVGGGEAKRGGFGEQVVEHVVGVGVRDVRGVLDGILACAEGSRP